MALFRESPKRILLEVVVGHPVGDEKYAYRIRRTDYTGKYPNPHCGEIAIYVSIRENQEGEPMSYSELFGSKEEATTVAKTALHEYADQVRREHETWETVDTILVEVPR